MDENRDVNEEALEEEVEIYTLTDENGKDEEFELIGSCEFEGQTYFALVPVSGDDEYVILREDTDGDERILVTIVDDDEFDRVADYFEDTVFGDIDYDEE